MKIYKIVLASFLLAIMLPPLQIGQNKIYGQSLPIRRPTYLANPACHFGITVPYGPSNLNGYDLSILGIDSYIDYSNGPKNSTVADNIQFLRVLQVGDAAFAMNFANLPSGLASYPGAVWIIGNEPDAEVKVQDNIRAEVYARRFFDMASLIRLKDPTATIVFGTILQPTPVRREYLKRVIAQLTALAGNLTDALALIDVYSIHAFSLPEDPLYDSNGDRIPDTWGAGVPLGYDESTWPPYYVWQNNGDVIDMNIFRSRVTDFRQWMNELGPLEQAKPLWITEYGSLFTTDLGISELTSAQYMEQTFDFLLGAKDPILGNPNDNDLLVQKWMWYSLNDYVTNFGGSLYDPITHRLTTVGDHFIKYNPSTTLVPVSPTTDVYIDQSSPTIEPGSPGHYRVTIKVGNKVSTDRLTGVTIDLLLGSTVVGSITANLPRCAGRMPVAFDIGYLTGGQSYTFTARVSPAAGNGTDTDPINNEYTFPPVTLPILYNLSLPIVIR